MGPLTSIQWPEASPAVDITKRRSKGILARPKFPHKGDMMKALTLWRPWAWALFHGKPVENRPWPLPPAMIGQVTAIHAGKKLDHDGGRFICDQLKLDKLPREARFEGIVGVVVWSRCITKHSDALWRSPWFFGPYGLVIGEHFEIHDPIPCRGMLGFWTVPAGVETEVRRQLDRNGKWVNRDPKITLD